MGNSNINVTRSGPEDFKDNPDRLGVADYTRDRSYRPYQKPAPDWRVTLARCGGGAIVGALGLGLYGLWKTAYCWGGANYLACGAINRWEPLVIGGAILGTLGLVAWNWMTRIENRRKLEQAEAYRMAIVQNRFGDWQPANLFDRVDPKTAIEFTAWQYQLSTTLKEKTAPHEKFWGVNTLTEGTNNSVQTDLGALQADAPIEDDGPKIVPLSTWLPWLTDETSPHLLLIGKTRSGKSTLADVLLQYRVDRGDEIAILDPHWSTQDKHGNRKWGGIRPRAKNAAEIARVLHELKDEYDARKRAMQLPASDPEFVPEQGFPPVTILIDEVPELVTELAANPDTKGLWNETVKIFGSGGAKVNMYCILLSQSPNVEDTGMNAKMRENFLIIALPNLERHFLDNAERDRARREQLTALLAKHTTPEVMPAQRPAVAEHAGTVHVLSRDGIMGYRQTSISAVVWEPHTSRMLTPPASAVRDNEMLAEMIATPIATVTIVDDEEDAVSSADPRYAAVKMFVKMGLGTNEIKGLVKGRSEVIGALIRQARVELGIDKG